MGKHQKQDRKYSDVRKAINTVIIGRERNPVKGMMGTGENNVTQWDFEPTGGEKNMPT